VYFRGIGKLFSFVDVTLYAPGEVITWGGFSSATDDLGIAAKFLYGAQDASQTEGVIFKLISKTPVPIHSLSFVVAEREHLFLPNATFRVRNWYEATQTNLLRGTQRDDGQAQDFVLNCDAITEPVPLQRVRNEEDLRSQLQHNKVLLIEMEQVLEEEEEAAAPAGRWSAVKAEL
jgi:hypothetical protein